MKIPTLFWRLFKNLVDGNFIHKPKTGISIYSALQSVSVQVFLMGIKVFNVYMQKFFDVIKGLLFKNL